MSRFLITGFPRSGTMYCSKVFQALGLDVQHERPGADGTVSWLEPTGERYDCRVMVTRNPLHVLSSATTLGKGVISNIFRVLDIAPKRQDFMYRLMLAYNAWAKYCDDRCALRFQVEQMELVWPSLLSHLGIPECPFPQDIDRQTNTRIHVTLDWSDLENVDRKLTSYIRRWYSRFGYDRDLLSHRSTT